MSATCDRPPPPASIICEANVLGYSSARMLTRLHLSLICVTPLADVRSNTRFTLCQLIHLRAKSATAAAFGCVQLNDKITHRRSCGARQIHSYT